MGVRQKAPDALTFKRGGRYKPLELMAIGSVPIPELPENYRQEVKDCWAVLWDSDLGRAFKATDAIGIQRWAFYLNEWYTATSYRPRDGRYIVSLEKSIRELERFYGLDPLSRLRLGLTLVDNAKAVQGLKAPITPEERTGT